MTLARSLTVAVLLALAFLPALFGDPAPRRTGPLEELRADLAWLRFQRARRDGDPERAVRLATLALERAPEDTGGWQLLSGYLGYQLCSPLVEPSLSTRRGWLEAALACARDGARSAHAPGELALARGLLLWNKAENDPGLGAADGDPDEGRRSLLSRAAAAFAEAGEDGLAAQAQERAAAR